MDRPSLYDDDIVTWAEEQAAALRALGARGELSIALDWENVAEEIESLGKSDTREVKSLARHILVHLIKLQVSTQTEPRSHWQHEIAVARDTLDDVLRDSPSLKARFPALVEEQWPNAIREAQRKLDGDRRAAAALRSLVYLKLAGSDAAKVLDPEYFPEPADHP